MAEVKANAQSAEAGQARLTVSGPLGSAAAEWKRFEPDYQRILSSHLAKPEERWRLEAEELGKKMVDAGLGPEVLIALHAEVFDHCVARADLLPEQEKLALEILIEAIMAYTMEYRRLAESRGREQERMTSHARVLEGLNRDLIAVHQELAERHEDLRKSHADLARLAQQKADLLATVTHEIRTPLTSVLGYGEFLEEGTYGDLNPEQADILHRMMQGGRDVLALINTLLDLSRLEAGRLHLDVGPLSLAEAIAQAAETVRAQAMRKRQTVEASEVQPDLPLVRADSLRVLEVLINILGNAVKFTPDDGRIVVGAAPRNGEVEVWVRDTGPGIDPEYQKQVFEKYTQARNGARRFGGSGLGLALCRELVMLHGGRIWVDSEPGKGATFRFTLPRWREEHHESGAA